MHKKLHKYFWDTGTSTGSNPDELPPVFRLRRILEYASFPDILLFSFEEVQLYLTQIDIARLRTNEHRKALLIAILPYLSTTVSWDEAIMTMVRHKLKQFGWTTTPDNTITS